MPDTTQKQGSRLTSESRAPQTIAQILASAAKGDCGPLGQIARATKAAR